MAITDFLTKRPQSQPDRKLSEIPESEHPFSDTTKFKTKPDFIPSNTDEQSIRESPTPFGQEFGNEEKQSITPVARTQQQIQQIEIQQQQQQQQQQRQIQSVQTIMAEPSGWKKLVDASLLFINPENKPWFDFNMMTDPNSTITGSSPFGIIAPGGKAIQVMKGGKLISAAAAKSQKIRLAFLKKNNIPQMKDKAGGIIGTINGIVKKGRISQVNTYKTKAAMSIIAKVGIAAGVSMAAVSLVKDYLSTMLMGQFVGNEEAPQTLDFGFFSASQINNETLRNEAMDMILVAQDELRSPEFQDGIRSKVPYVSMKTGLDAFWDSFEIKAEVNKMVAEDLKQQSSAGENNQEFWARINSEKVIAQDLERQKNLEQEQLLTDLWNEAKALNREADAAMYKKNMEDRSKQEEKDRIATGDYWTEYNKVMLKVKANTAPSNLKFGLL